MYNYIFGVIPPHFGDFIRQLILPCNHSYSLHLKNKKKILVMVCADYGNLGDIAIAYAQIGFLTKRFPDYSIIPVLISDTFRNIKCLKKIIGNDDIITIVGGGNNGSLYPGIEFSRIFTIKSFPENRIISFPQTLTINENSTGKKIRRKMKKVYSRHKNLILVARDAQTFNEYGTLFPNKRILCPDIALTICFKPTARRNNTILCCLRDDVERFISDDLRENLNRIIRRRFKNVANTDTTNDKIYTDIDVAFVDLKEKLTEFSAARAVLTDRLHGMIFCYITKTPCVILPCNNQKIKGCFDFIDKCNFIRYIESNDPNEIADAISGLPEPEYCVRQNLDKFYDELEAAIIG